MGVQSFTRLVQSLAGMLYTLTGALIGAASNAVRQKSLIVVTTAENSADFKVTINGTLHTYASDGSATKTEISAGLVALINAGAQAAAVVAVDLVESFTIESLITGTAYTISVTNPSTGVLTLTSLLASATTIGFGLWVTRDQSATPGDNVSLPTLAADISTAGKMRGITLRDPNQDSAVNQANNVGFPIQAAMNILEHGYGWVDVEDYAAVRPGMPVFARHVATGTEKLGASRTDVDGSDAVLVPGAYFYTLANAENRAVVEYGIRP